MSQKLSISERVLAEIECRLRGVMKADGFRTDAGLRVFRARRTVSPEDTPCFVVWRTRTDFTGAAGNNRSVDAAASFDIVFHTKADQDETGVMVEAGAADIKQAICQWTGGIGADGAEGTFKLVSEECTPRDDGYQTEFVITTFVAHFREGYGYPYDQSRPR